MKRQMLSACFIALGMVGCSEEKWVENKPIVVFPKPVITAPSPVVVESKADSGVRVAQEEWISGDALVQQHEHKVGTQHLLKARELKEMGDLDGALAEAQKSLFDAPSDEESLSLVAHLARRVDQKEVAAAAFGRLAELRPDDAVPVIQEARMRLSMGDNVGAVGRGEESIKRDPANPEGYQVVGRAHLNEGQLAQAIAFFEKAVEVDPSHGYALNNLGFAYLRSNQNEKALEVLTKAATALPHIAYVHNNLGVALERLGKRDEAQVAYNQAMALSPKYLKALINSERVAALKFVEKEPSEPTPPSE